MVIGNREVKGAHRLQYLQRGWEYGFAPQYLARFRENSLQIPWFMLKFFFQHLKASSSFLSPYLIELTKFLVHIPSIIDSNRCSRFEYRTNFANTGLKYPRFIQFLFMSINIAQYNSHFYLQSKTYL